ncbi:pimeloyl-ACP methyl ester carboxylesterase [Rhodococcus sp. 27YEA15]|uniref:alpha/beta fold hydrolase n=1 Tax=Rhodococcus sp. 27YEA15 TaxID=3156259 RepID=UPI003C7E81D9
MTERAGAIEYVDVEGGRIAYEVTGDGPLVVFSPGMGDIRSTYRFLAPLIVAAGYRVACADLRGHGDSTTGWDSYTRTDTAGDLVAIVRALGGPAVIVGQSFSGGAATIAAATNPTVVTAIVEIDPFTHSPEFSAAALLRNAPYRRGAFRLGRFLLTGRVSAWSSYLESAYSGRTPADWDGWLPVLHANLSEPGRVAAVREMAMAKPSDAAAKLADVQCPTLVIMGADDADFVDPESEAATIVDLLPAGLGSYRMIEHAGHYPHAQYPHEVAQALLPFLAEHHRA